MKKNKGVMYSIIHDRLKDKACRDNCILKKDLFALFGRVYHIPKAQRGKVLGELVEFKMIKPFKRGVLKVL